MAQTASLEVLQLKIVLDQIVPAIWRRMLIPASFSLAKLHDAIQIAFGWDDSHLHVFTIHGRDFGPVDSEGDGNKRSERIALTKLKLIPKTKFRYEYDFGDSWIHEITVEKVLAPKELVLVPVCIEGKRACPPEDCGGPWGYENMLEAAKDPKHPEHGEIMEWLGSDWDPEAIQLDVVNASLEEVFKPRRHAIIGEVPK